MASYIVNATPTLPPMKGDWAGPEWAQANVLEIARFRPESANHHPCASVRLLHHNSGICGMFMVRDQYVRCTHTHYMDPVCKDSCVEFFVEPEKDKGYFNFEFNCGGTLLCNYIVDHKRTKDGFEDFTPLPYDHGKQIVIYHSMPTVVEPEITHETNWTLQFFIPFSVLESYVGPIQSVQGKSWRGNFFKCGDDTSRPHWASWMPVDELNFHLPDCFGTIRFQ